jgi:hypothetical protein
MLRAFSGTTVRMVVGFPPAAVRTSWRASSHRSSPKPGHSRSSSTTASRHRNDRATLVARSTPDGYTLLMGHLSSNAIAPSLFKVPYDPARISLRSRWSRCSARAGRASERRGEIGERSDRAREESTGRFKFPSAGDGTPAHLAGEIFKLMAGVDMQHVPYKGSGQSVADLIAGQVSLSFDSTPTVLTYIKAGRLRPLRGHDDQRTPVLPEIPTLDESGLRGYQVALVRPVRTGRTPSELVRKVHAASRADCKRRTCRRSSPGSAPNETVNRNAGSLPRPAPRRYREVCKDHQGGESEVD